MITISWVERVSRALPEGGDSETITTESLVLDIVEQDTYDVASKLTAKAVETGIPITDHVILMQDRISFTANVSGRQSTTRLVEGARSGSIDLGDENDTTAAGIIVPEGTDRIGDVHDTLRRICREAIEVDVDGLRRPIEGWIVEKVSSPRTIDTSGLLVVDVSLVEVLRAEVEETEAPSPRVERGRRQRNRGRQSTQAVETTETVSGAPESRADDMSILEGLFQDIGL